MVLLVSVKQTRLNAAMRVKAQSLWRRVSIPQALLIASAFAYGGVFALIVAFGRPGLGIGQAFYVPVILAAAATTPAFGAVAGAGALFLYELGMRTRTGLSWSDFTDRQALIRLASYVAAGCVAGFLAVRARRMLAQALSVLDELVELAQINVSHVIADATTRGAAPPRSASLRGQDQLEP